MKKEIISFCVTRGWSCHYSGREKTVYINSKKEDVTEDSIVTEIVQHFGVYPELVIRKI